MPSVAEYVSDFEYYCPICGKHISVAVEVPEPDWAGYRAEDRARNDQIDVTCPECDSSETLAVTNLDGSVSATFIRFPDRIVNTSTGYTNDYGLFDDVDDIPSSPIDVLRRSVGQVSGILEDRSTIWNANAACRMIFAYYFSAFEAYLSDALARHLRFDHESLHRLVTRDKVLCAERVKLSQVLEKKDLVWRTVREHLNEIPYHNFPRVEMLYRCGPTVDIWPNDEIKRRLYDAVPLRHDIVHRNGVDKEGRQHDLPDRPYLARMAEDIMEVALHIDNALLKTARSEHVVSGEELAP